MLLSAIARVLEAELLGAAGAGADLDVATCFAADLMSEVLAFCAPGALLLTGLTNLQAVHTADMAELAAIAFVNGKRPPQPVIDLARGRGLPLLTTPLTLFDACGRLHGRGLEPARKG